MQEAGSFPIEAQDWEPRDLSLVYTRFIFTPLPKKCMVDLRQFHGERRVE